MLLGFENSLGAWSENIGKEEVLEIEYLLYYCLLSGNDRLLSFSLFIELVNLQWKLGLLGFNKGLLDMKW